MRHDIKTLPTHAQKLAEQAEIDMRALCAQWDGANGQAFRASVSKMPLYALDGDISYTIRDAFIKADDGQYFPPYVAVELTRSRGPSVELMAIGTDELDSYQVCIQRLDGKLFDFYL